MPYQSPVSDIGILQREVDSIKRELHDKANNWEIHEMQRKMMHLENVLGEMRLEINQIVYQLQTLEEKMRENEAYIDG
jgi:transcription initiation factor IIE alpha subunit